MDYTMTKKHLKRVVPKDGYKAVLKGVYHNENTVIGTDSKRLLLCEVENENFKEAVIDIKNDEVIDEKYPNTESLFLKNPDVQLSIDVNVIKSMKRVLRCCKQLGYEYVQFVKKDNYWYIMSDNNRSFEDKADMRVNIEYQVAEDVESKEQTRIFQTAYLINALAFIEDTKEDAELSMVDSTITPIQFSHLSDGKTKYKYLIMPVRRY